MSYTIAYDLEEHLIEMKYQGDLALTDIKQVVTELAQVVKETNCNFLLNDFREANVRLSTSDIYQLPRIMQDTYAASGINVLSLKRAAVLVRDLKDAQFFETVSVNRGHAVKVFSDVEEAKRWVVGE